LPIRANFLRRRIDLGPRSKERSLCQALHSQAATAQVVVAKNSSVDDEQVNRQDSKDHRSDSLAALVRGSGRRGPNGPFIRSLGLQNSADGTIYDVRVGGSADKAKLAPGQKLIAIDSLVAIDVQAPEADGDDGE
jgi:hypothetical protein